MALTQGAGYERSNENGLDEDDDDSADRHEDIQRFKILPETQGSKPDEIGKKDISVDFKGWGDASVSRPAKLNMK